MMKAGTDSPLKTGLAILLGILAIFYVARWAIGSHATRPAAHAAAQSAKGQSISSLDPTLRTDLLKDEEGTKYESKGRNIFLLQAELPQPQTPVYTPPPTPQPIVQGPPPIPVKFFGYANRPGEAKRVFLSRDQDIWVAKEGDVIDRRYKIVRINPTSVEVEDVLSNNRQSIPLSHS
jgi:hypothetical protein